MQVARPVGNFKFQAEYQYQTLRCNVDMLKLIQLGLTFTDAEGNLPMIDNSYCLWQFNFREFSLKEDMYAQDSIELLKHSGIDFQVLHLFPRLRPSAIAWFSHLCLFVIYGVS